MQYGMYIDPIHACHSISHTRKTRKLNVCVVYSMYKAHSYKHVWIHSVTSTYSYIHMKYTAWHLHTHVVPLFYLYLCFPHLAIFGIVFRAFSHGFVDIYVYAHIYVYLGTCLCQERYLQHFFQFKSWNRQLSFGNYMLKQTITSWPLDLVNAHEVLTISSGLLSLGQWSYSQYGLISCGARQRPFAAGRPTAHGSGMRLTWIHTGKGAGQLAPRQAQGQTLVFWGAIQCSERKDGRHFAGRGGLERRCRAAV